MVRSPHCEKKRSKLTRFEFWLSQPGVGGSWKQTSLARDPAAARDGPAVLSTALRRRPSGIRIGDLAGAFNKPLGQRSQRATLDRDEADRGRRRQDFDRQNLDAHVPATKAHDGGRDETNP